MAQMMGMMGGAGGMSSMAGGVTNIVGGIATMLLSRKEAETLEEIGYLEGLERRRKTAKLMGAQVAGYAKGGVQLSGTPLDVMAETAATEELDALRLEYEYKSAARAKTLQGIEALLRGIGQGGSTVGQTILGNNGTRRGTVPTSIPPGTYYMPEGSVNIVNPGGTSGRGYQVFQ